MDTNLIHILVTTMLANQNKTQAAGGPDGLSNLLIAGLLLLAAVAPTLVSLASYLQAKALKLESLEVKSTTAQTLGVVSKLDATSKETAVTLEKVHVAVNSERSATLALVGKLREEILGLVEDKATTAADQKGKDAAIVVKDATIAREAVTARDMLARDAERGAAPEPVPASTGVTDAQVSLMVQALIGHLEAKRLVEEKEKA